MSPPREGPVVLWQMSRIWGIPNPSPFCMKVETWLRMAGIRYEARAIQGPPRSSTRKVPFIERPDGTLLADSGRIIRVLSAERGIDLDRDLGPRERAESLMLRRLLEEHLYFLVLAERWVDDAGWDRCRGDYFAAVPPVLRTLLPPIIRRQVKRDAHGQGLARLDPAERLLRAEADLEAVATVLGVREHFFGAPSTVDAVALAFLTNMLRVPVDGPVHRVARRHDNLVRYEARLLERYFPELVHASAPR
jgi:glutathione S-transferase